VLTQHPANLVLAPHDQSEHALSQQDQTSPAAYVDTWHAHRRDHVQQQQLGQLLGVDAVVLAFGAVDQSQLARMGDRDMMRQRPQLLVEVPVSARGFVADVERLRELSQPIDDRRAWAFNLNLVDRSAAGVENTQRRLTRMNV